MRFLQDWTTILLRVQYLGFPGNGRRSKLESAIHGITRRSWSVFLYVCILVGGSTSIFSLKWQVKKLHFRNRQKFCTSGFCRYTYYSSLFLDWSNQEKSAVLQSFNGTNLQLWQNDCGRNAPGRVQYDPICINHHPEAPLVMRDSLPRWDLVWRFVCSLAVQRSARSAQATYAPRLPSTYMHLLSSRKFPAHGWWANECKMCKIKTW